MKSQRVSLIDPNLVTKNDGFIAVLLMVTIMVVAIIALLSNGAQKREFQINTESKFSTDLIQQNYMNYVQDDEAWKNTLKDPRNTSLACILSGAVCDTSLQQIAVLKNANDEVVVDSASGKGILQDGTVCSIDTNSPANSSSCLLHVSLSWQPLCNGICKNPPLIQVKISIDNATEVEGNAMARFIASSDIGLGSLRKPLPMPVASQVATGNEHTCAIADGGVYCWGRNNVRQLGPAFAGANSPTPVKITGLTEGVTQISTAEEYTCAIKDGNVFCWGVNLYGVCGLPGGVPQSTPNKILDRFGNPLTNIAQIATDADHACALTSTGAVFCWGSNAGGVLGYLEVAGISPGDANWLTVGRAYPVLDLSRGINGADLGPVTNISAGLDHNCAVINGAVKCWGNNDQRGGMHDICYNGMNALGYDPDGPKGYKICWPYIDAGTVLPGKDPDPDPTKWNTSANPALFSGHFSTCGPVTTANRITKCNPRPQLTDEPLLAADVKQVVVIGISTCALKNSGILYCWGQNWGRLARNPTDSSPFTIPLGTGSGVPLEVKTITGIESLSRTFGGFCGLKAGTVYCWGDNGPYNNFGHPTGNTGYIWNPFALTGLPANIYYIHYGSGGSSHGCAIADEKVYCWGRNAYGQLGDGTTTNQAMGIPTTVRQW